VVDPRDLRNLLSLYEHRHFGKAAREVSLSQPALSKSIQRLERGFGFALFDRSRSHVEPTAVCESVISDAKSVLTTLRYLEETVRQLSGLEAGSLAIGVGPAMAESFVTEAVGSLAQDRPGIQVEMRVDHWEQLSEWIIAGEIEVLVADLAEIGDDSRFRVTPLPQQEFKWFCQRSHPLAAKKHLSRNDLLRYPLATPRMPRWAIAWFDEVLAADEQENGSVALPTVRCESYSTLKRIVLNSNCVSVALSATIQPELDAGLLVALPVDASPLKTNAGIVQLRKRTLSPLAVAMVDRFLELTANE